MTSQLRKNLTDLTAKWGGSSRGAFMHVLMEHYTDDETLADVLSDYLRSGGFHELSALNNVVAEHLAGAESSAYSPEVESAIFAALKNELSEYAATWAGFQFAADIAAYVEASTNHTQLLNTVTEYGQDNSGNGFATDVLAIVVKHS